MLRPKTFFLPAMLFLVPAVVSLTARGSLAESATEECKAKPDSSAPSGSHWYYRLNRADKRHCWYLGPQGAKAHSAASEPTSLWRFLISSQTSSTSCCVGLSFFSTSTPCWTTSSTRFSKSCHIFREVEISFVSHCRLHCSCLLSISSRTRISAGGHLQGATPATNTTAYTPRRAAQNEPDWGPRESPISPLREIGGSPPF